MMNGLLNVLHPTFDALSAYADLSELDGQRSRVGRHVTRCAQCREVVGDIRGLGTAARAAEADAACDTESAPDNLWARIEVAAVEAAQDEAKPRETPQPGTEPWEVAPSLRPTRHWPIPTKRSLARIGGSVAVAAAALLAVALGTGDTPSLLANAPSRLTVTPFRPAPGSTVHVRFNPPPSFAAEDKLVLIGQYLSDAKRASTDFYFGGTYDSLAVLRRAADGAMVGDFRVPSDFGAVSLVVVEPSGRRYAADGLHSWIVVGGDSRGRPVLNSLLAAFALDGLYGSASRASVLDTLQRYFPDHPAGFATARRYRGEGMFADLFRFFQGAERKYIAFNSKLAKQAALDATVIASMVDFAYELQEPGEAARWTRRLVLEHPDDPRALPYYARMVHEMELEELPADSIRPYVGLLDSLFERAVSLDASFVGNEGVGIVNRYGSAAMQRRWALRSLQRARNGRLSLNINPKWLEDREIRDQAVITLRAGLAARCKLPGWMTRAGRSEQQRVRHCGGVQGSALAALSEIALIDGQTSRALSLADSAVERYRLAGTCWSDGGHSARGHALLARGDTVAASREFAYAYAPYDNWQTIAVYTAIVKRIGAAVDSTTWAAFGAEGKSELKRCMGAARVRDSLERRVR